MMDYSREVKEILFFSSCIIHTYTILVLVQLGNLSKIEEAETEEEMSSNSRFLSANWTALNI